MRVLLVEDDDIVADAILRGLTAANYSVHRVGSAEAAQAAIADEVCSVLMGDDVESRKRFITTNAGDVRFLDI